MDIIKRSIQLVTSALTSLRGATKCLNIFSDIYASAIPSHTTKSISVGKKFLGSSDIIESVFAKYKNFSARTPMKGIGKTVLTIPVFLSQITSDKVGEALRSCPCVNLSKWLSDHIGQSVFAQRAKAFAN